MPYRIILAAIMYRFYDFRIWAVEVEGRGRVGRARKRDFQRQPAFGSNQPFLPPSILFITVLFPLFLILSPSLPFPLVPVPRGSLYRDRGEYRKFSGILTLPINALTGACTRLEDFRFPFAINAIAKNARQRDPIAIHTIHHGVFTTRISIGNRLTG